MERKIKIMAGITALAAAAALGTGVAIAGGGDDEDDPPIRGEARHKAEAAALEHTGGGRVTGTEEGDEESLYEVEVTKEDGSRVDVQLDEHFKVVGDEVDDADEDEDADEDDD